MHVINLTFKECIRACFFLSANALIRVVTVASTASEELKWYIVKKMNLEFLIFFVNWELLSYEWNTLPDANIGKRPGGMLKIQP